jgi:dihydroxyacetone kinase-like predicted kinase
VPIGIAYLDGPRLARTMFAASEWVAAGREEINRINVFPVPDGDTGTNLSLTLRAVADALQRSATRRFRRPPGPWPAPPSSAPGATRA